MLILQSIPCMQAMAELNWKPEFSLLEGLKDSYDKDFGRGTFRKAADFSKDDMVGQMEAATVWLQHKQPS